jgi:hypothetical protein
MLSYKYFHNVYTVYYNVLCFSLNITFHAIFFTALSNSWISLNLL